MRDFEVFGVALLIVLAALLAGSLLVFARRWLLARSGGTIGMVWRLSTLVAGRGWAHGFGRFQGDELRWYRMFSLALRPRRILTRHDLTVQQRRAPQGAERLAMPEGWVVLRCRKGPGTGRVGGGGRGGGEAVVIEFAVAESALTGLLSWLEAAPPGALRRP